MEERDSVRVMTSLLVTVIIVGAVTPINVVTRTEDSLARSGSSLSLHCYTDRPWFLCVWTTEIGEKQFKHCAIQETRVSSVCAGDPRIVISGGDTRCSITINNVTSEVSITDMRLIECHDCHYRTGETGCASSRMMWTSRRRRSTSMSRSARRL